jgi:hypothetical protein
MSPRVQVATGLGLGLAVLTGWVGGCATHAEPARTSATAVREAPASMRIDMTAVDVGLGFDGIGLPGDVVPVPANDGRADVEIEVVTADGGDLVRARGSAGWAVRTPIYRPEGPVPAAAVVIHPVAGAPDVLDPGDADFLFGAEFMADPPDPGRPEDNGANLVQRGRYGSGAQVKIDVDHGVPACRVSGDDGEVLLKADVVVEPDHWYAVTCTRTGTRIELTLVDLEDPAAEPRSWGTSEPVGRIRLAGTYVSIGAKVASDGGIDQTSVDQFNGVIDRVVVDVGS